MACRLKRFLTTGVRIQGEWLCLSIPSVIFTYSTYASSMLIYLLAIFILGENMFAEEYLPAQWDTYAMVLAIATIFFTLCWATKRYTQYNHDHGLTRADNKMTMSYVAGTLMSMPIAGVITYFATGPVGFGILQFPEMGLGVFIGLGLILNFFITGLCVIACHEGVTAATRWVAQGVQDASDAMEELLRIKEENEKLLAALADKKLE